MAGVSGISRILTSLASGLSQLRAATAVQRPVPSADNNANQGRPQQETYSRPRQLINIDGQVFDRHARRGSYVDILV